MKNSAIRLVLFSGMLFWYGCTKETPVPAIESPEHTSLLQGTCRNYWYYYGDQPRSLGDPKNNIMVIGFKKGTSLAKKLKVINEYPALGSINNSSQFHNSDLTTVNLNSNLTCAGIGDLMYQLATDNQIEYSGAYFDFSPGIAYATANVFLVTLKSQTTNAQLNNLLKTTKTEIIKTEYGMYFIKTTRQSPKNCLETANQFYESGLCIVAEPDFIIQLL